MENQKFRACLPLVGCLSLLLFSNSAFAQHAPYGSGSVGISGSGLIIMGTELNDHASVVEISGDRISVVLNGKKTKFPAAGITEIGFQGEEGNDYLTNRTSLLTIAFGGEGDDFLKSTKGPAMFYGGVGDDLLIGSPEDDLLCGGSGDDVVIGNNGDDDISGDAVGTGGGGGGGGFTDVQAEMVGTDAFARGKFVQIGLSMLGTFGADATMIPAGYVDTLAEGRSANGLFGFIADSAKDGYGGGSYDGDFFIPGTPEEGFGVEIEGTNYNNNTTDGLFQIPGMITSVVEGTSADINWEGSIEGLDITRKISVFENGLFIRIEVTLTNTFGEPLLDIFFHNNVDPDNDQTVHGSYTTFNAIISQGDIAVDNLSLVTAQQTQTGPGMSGGTESTGSALSLVAFDPRARVAYGGFSNRNASDIYNADGFEGTVGATNTADEAIALAFNIGDLADGESTTLVYYYSLDPTGIDVGDIIDNENACADDGDDGDDLVFGGSGEDDIETSGGDDIVYGGPGNDTINTGLGMDYIYGQSGDDSMDAGPGNDRIYGGGGNDLLNGAAGDDLLVGNGGNDLLRGANGNDFLNGGAHDDTLLGHRGDDTLYGASGDDILYGGPGDDKINGGTGNDNENQ